MTGPARSRRRFYRDPNTGEAPGTEVLSVRLDETPRFVLLQSPEDGEYVVIVADADGRIPVFLSERAAREYIARYFPLAGEDGNAKDAATRRWQEERAARPPAEVDFELALRWANNPAQRAAGPSDVIHAWEMLFCADAAPPSPFFDPMGFVELVSMIAEGRDRAENEFLLTGMKLRAIVGLYQREYGPAARAPWPDDTDEWNEADDARLAPIIRNGVADFAARLSTDAATTDVAATWPRPVGPQLRAAFFQSGTTELEEMRAPPQRWSDAEFALRLLDAAGPPASAANYPGLSAGALERFARDQDEYLREMRAVHQMNAQLSDDEARTLYPDIMVLNDGDRRAEKLDVRMRVPAGIIVVPSGSVPFSANAPQPLPAAASYEDPNVKRPHAIPTYRPSDRDRGAISSYNPGETIEAQPDGTTLVSGLYSRGVAAHERAYPSNALLRFPSWQMLRPFTIDVEMQADGGDVWTTRLLIDAKRFSWSLE